MAVDIKNVKSTGKQSLAEWVNGHVAEWEHYRDTSYEQRWDEYYRLWRGIWSPEDSQRLKERSKAIMPALQQAVESAVGEIEEAVFGRVKWFDVADDVQDEEAADMIFQSILLREDFDLTNVPSALSEVFILAAIYGTGIGKVVVERAENRSQVKIKLVPIDPREFAIDPVARTVDDAMGCAHVTYIPHHIVVKKQELGIYNPVMVGSLDDSTEGSPNPEEKAWTDQEKVKICEYHGRVPAKMLGVEPDDKKLRFEDDGLVEAIVTIGNDNALLRAVRNPFEKRDRSIIAFQFDTVPNSFWGRGIMEKGYWPQKVLDTEIRARIEALAFSTMPMMAVNGTAIPRGETYEARPGKNLFLNTEVTGNIQPITFPPPDPQTYRQTADMERMVEMATGQLQAASPEDVNLKNSTASGISMMMSGSIKRSKRTLLNIERNFLTPLVKKSLWRYQQFDNRYPQKDVRFKVLGTLGMVARELEVNQMIQLLQLIPAGSPPFWTMVGQIVEQTSLSKREQIMAIVGDLMQLSMQPQEPERDLAGEARLISAQARQSEVEANTSFRDREIAVKEAEMLLRAEEQQRQRNERLIDLELKAATQEIANVKTQADAVLSIAKAEAEEAGTQLEVYKAEIEAMLKDQQNKPQPVNEADLEARIQEVIAKQPNGSKKRTKPQRIDIQRDDRGLVQTVNGLPVRRNPTTNLIEGIG